MNMLIFLYNKKQKLLLQSFQSNSKESMVSRVSCFFLIMLMMTFSAYSQSPSSNLQHERIDSIVLDVLESTGTPSASIAVVLKGKVAYEKAYGLARLSPDKVATTKMRYAIASNTKQFVATAVLLLLEDKELSLDDKVFKWLPSLTRAKDISIRQLLSMTAGYQDYWPQDYVPSYMLEPVFSRDILKRWASIPLDFEPGTKYQYSNTNYIIAGIIVEKISGMSLFDFLQKRIFIPLGMTSVKDFDLKALDKDDAAGYLRNALGPLRLAPKEAKGWLFAAAQLAMTPHDLALWDISIINETLLKPSSYKIMQTDVLLNNGIGTQYGLGIDVTMSKGRRRISHGGAASGYVTANDIYPDESVAIIVFTNIFPGAVGPDSQIASRIAKELFETPDTSSNEALDQAKLLFTNLQEGKIIRNALTANANAYFSKQAVSDFATSLGPLGKPTEFSFERQSIRGGMITHVYKISIGDKMLELTTRSLPDGKLEQFTVEQVSQ